MRMRIPGPNCQPGSFLLRCRLPMLVILGFLGRRGITRLLRMGRHRRFHEEVDLTFLRSRRPNLVCIIRILRMWRLRVQNV